MGSERRKFKCFMIHTVRGIAFYMLVATSGTISVLYMSFAAFVVFACNNYSFQEGDLAF